MANCVNFTLIRCGFFNFYICIVAGIRFLKNTSPTTAVIGIHIHTKGVQQTVSIWLTFTPRSLPPSLEDYLNGIRDIKVVV